MLKLQSLHLLPSLRQPFRKTNVNRFYCLYPAMAALRAQVKQGVISPKLCLSLHAFRLHQHTQKGYGNAVVSSNSLKQFASSNAGLNPSRNGVENKNRGGRESGGRPNYGKDDSSSSSSFSSLKTKKKTKFKRNFRDKANQKQANQPAAPLPKGVVHIQSSFNNTIITVTNLRGRVIAWSSAGANGFKGARKSTPFAAKIAAKAAGRASFDQGLKLVKVMVKGGGSGRETAMRGLIEAGLQLAVIRDITGVPHNGCRPPKKRRV